MQNGIEEACRHGQLILISRDSSSARQCNSNNQPIADNSFLDTRFGLPRYQHTWRYNGYMIPTVQEQKHDCRSVTIRAVFGVCLDSYLPFENHILIVSLLGYNKDRTSNVSEKE